MVQTLGAPNDGGDVAAAETWNDFVTVDQAASILRVSRSTLWRWLKTGVLPAYRIGGRRVWLQRSDLMRLVKPVNVAPNTASLAPQRGRHHERVLAPRERQQMLAAVEAASRLQASLLRTRGGKLFRPAHEEIAEARRERLAARE